MSDIPKINSTLSSNLKKMPSFSTTGPVSNEYYEKATQINNITGNQVNLETMNFYATPISDPKAIAIQTILQTNLSDFAKKVANYQNTRGQELKEYNTMLTPIQKEIEKLDENLARINELKNNYETYKQDGEDRIYGIISGYQTFCSEEKLKELGLTKEELRELDYLELLEICRNKDSSIKKIQQDIEQYKTNYLDKEIEKLTGFSTFQEYSDTIKNLKNDQAVLLSAIRVTKEDINCAKYKFLLSDENYQNYSYKETDLEKLSPLERVRNAKSQNLSLIYENYDDLKHLIQASKSNSDLSKMYNYLYETEGLESANQYVENMKSTMNQICGMQQAEVFLDKLKNEENIVDAVTNHLKTTGKGLTTGVDSFAQGISSWFTSSDIYTIHDYETMYILQELQTNENYNGLLDNNYEISQSIGNMLPSIVLSMVLTPAVGTTSMGISAGGNNYHSALAEGQSKDKAVLYGVINGVSEATLEKYLGAIPGLSNVSVTGLKTFAQAMMKEGIEEGTQEYLDALVRNGLFDEEFNMEEVSKNASKSAIYGAITGGIMNTPSLAVSGVNRIENNTSNVESIETNRQVHDNIEVLNSDIYELSTDGLEGPLKDIVEDWNSMGTIDLEIGKQIENLFNKKDTLSGIHMTPDLSSANQILIEGLQLTGHSSSGSINNNIDLDLNVSFTKQGDFLAIPKFFRNIKSSSFYKNYTGTNVGYAMVIQIPSDADIPTLTYQKNGITYLKPEYIQAQIEVENGNISNSINTIFKNENLTVNQMLK